MTSVMVFEPVTQIRGTIRTHIDTLCKLLTPLATKVRAHRPCEPKRAQSVLQKHKAAP
jgi:hypothetical protein